MKDRIFNFSAGPSTMPEEVLKRAADELVCYQDSGMSVMEMSHRSSDYQKIIDSAESSLREVMGIGDDYEVLFLQGGASTQFAAVPLNLTRKGMADYALTGQFSSKAASEAEKYTDVRVAASSKDKEFSYIPSQKDIKIDIGADYFHMCTNNTIFGTRWGYIPDTKGVPIVADMSSEILSRPVDVSKYSLIYAGAQKNMGIAGLTVVIVKKDMIYEDLPEYVPTMLRYSVMSKNKSMYNTPPTYSIYILSLVLDWIKSIGGLCEMEKRNVKKADLLYSCLDASELFVPVARPDSRSIMNVTFRLKDESLDKKFIEQAKERGIVNIKGHRSVGGMRASIYNAMEYEGVKALVDFMEQFEKEYKASK